MREEIGQVLEHRFRRGGMPGLTDENGKLVAVYPGTRDGTILALHS